MAVTDTTIYFGLGLIFIYLVGYRMNKYLGYVMFIALGFLMLWKGETDAAKAIGAIIVPVSVLGAIIYWLKGK